MDQVFNARTLFKTVKDREKSGRLAREAVSRRELTRWEPADPARDSLALLMSQESTRVQALLPLRHYRMAQSPFAFYRGSAILMATDLAVNRPRSGLNVQLCGDAHLANFGLFAVHDRSIVFDVNDFDETHQGPFEWDVLRLVTSFVIGAQSNGFTAKEATTAAHHAARGYRRAIHRLSRLNPIEIFYERMDETRLKHWLVDIDGKDGARRLTRHLARAEKRDQWSAINKLTEVHNGIRQFQNIPPVLTRITHAEPVRDKLRDMFKAYRKTLPMAADHLLSRYDIVDIGHKVVGVGSVGLLAYVLLLQGRDENDLLVLQAKEAVPSVLERYTQANPLRSEGLRVIHGQCLMQAAHDAFLGWIEAPLGRSFYVRQLRDKKWAPLIEEMKLEGLSIYAELCGEVLARCHARTGDCIAISSYLGKSEKFDHLAAEFGNHYAGQVADDYQRFTTAIRQKHIIATDDLLGPEFITSAESGILVDNP
jgi:uncharacterized protein (DUF2252 family)